MKRDITIDRVRGFAIFTMVIANAAGVGLLFYPPPLCFRFLGTFAAPLFIFVSGMMVCHTAKTNKYGLGHFVVRLILLWLIALFVDFILDQNSFSSIDVLWLIGLSLPVSYLSTKLNKVLRLLLVFIIFALVPILQFYLGYVEDPETPFGLNLVCFKHWIVDGWFPIFPWIGYSILGTLGEECREKIKSISIPQYWYLPFLVFIIGSLIWYLYPGKLMLRNGYSEMFYPPEIGYMAMSVCVIFIVFFVFEVLQSYKLLDFLSVLGEAALFMYVVQYYISSHILLLFFKDEPIYKFFFLFFVLMIFLILLGYLLRTVRNKWVRRPYLVKFIIG